ncbi:alpha/beta hydrolase [Geomicrobium sp. JCM 19038]|uniref:alpha/beta hydrolase n=1 Tax=Geomicrobium sp. JCM 19038 TaxID=1460635 RepID=UPI00045F352C|nr:alpha/beta hydrolase [Geomicrobium sp. JCM 19038]GAK07172.1 esterase/lipase [Geomicrobium sp. JCM 19038]
MTLDPTVKAILEEMEKQGLPGLEMLSPEEARVNRRIGTDDGQVVEEVNRVENLSFESEGYTIPVRVYQPEGTTPQPVLLYFHGGGWVLGDLDSHDPVCRRIANASQSTVISVEYRLAPEYPFPAAVYDCYNAVYWVREQAEILGIDKERVAVGGDSAGGNLAAVVTHLLKERNETLPVYQLLIYPSVDFTKKYPSDEKNKEGLFLTGEAMSYFRKHYLSQKEDKFNPLASPMVRDDVTGLPPAHIITAEYDPLRDQGEAYATRLKEAGNEVTYIDYKGMVHGFISMANLVPQGAEALTEVGRALQARFNEVKAGK